MYSRFAPFSFIISLVIVVCCFGNIRSNEIQEKERIQMNTISIAKNQPCNYKRAIKCYAVICGVSAGVAGLSWLALNTIDPIDHRSLWTISAYACVISCATSLSILCVIARVSMAWAASKILG